MTVLCPVVDLFDVQGNKEISLEEVMDGLRYVMEYRIKGGRFPSLDYDIMKRLADGLLMNMGNSVRKGRFGGGVILTEEADVAFQLFGEFILEGTLSLLCISTSRSVDCNPRVLSLTIIHSSILVQQCRSSVRQWEKSQCRIFVMRLNWMSVAGLDLLSRSSKRPLP